MKRLILLLSFLCAITISLPLNAGQLPEASAPVAGSEPSLVARVRMDARCHQWVDSVLQQLTLKERIGQLLIYTIAPQQTKENRALLRKVVKEYHVGGLLFSGGQIEDQVALTNEAQQLADVPLMITFDGEWGLSMRLKGTPVFPKNKILGAIQNDSLIYEYGREMARQCREMGVQVNFAPVADVNINPRNPVINTRSFGDDPVNVANKVAAYAKGLEDGGVLSVCKHFPGHGDTEVDSHKALPTLPFTRERLDSIELYPFRQAIQAGLGGIMVGHLAVPALEPEQGLPASLSQRVVTDLLKEELGFKGLVFTDALAMKGVSGHASLCLRALQAGNDLLLVPRRIKEDVEAILHAVKQGELSELEITERCRKVLTYKYALGLAKKPHVRLSGLANRLDTPETRDLIRRLNEAATAKPQSTGIDAGKLARIDSIALEGIRQGAYPGCQVLVWKDGKQVYGKAFGTHTGKNGQKGSGKAPLPVTMTDVYDLASLTKTTATLLAVMKLYDQGLLNLTDYVADYLPFLQESDKKRITVRDLLLHESGLPPTILFYQEAIDKESYSGALFRGQRDAQHPVRIASRTWANPKFRFREGLTSPVPTEEYTMQVSDSLWLHRSFKAEYLQQIADATLRDKRYRYSCVGFIVLQQLVEARTGIPMDEFLAREFYVPMGLTHTGFLPLRFLKKDEIVPSSQDSFLRKTTLQGFVHDESAAFQGGVSGNAGLFSNVGEVACVYQMLLNGGVWNGKRYLGEETCRLFTTTTSRISRRSLGFDRPDPRNSSLSPCADNVPASVFGHTGFTGTCAWADPDNRLVYVFLSNRIYPNAWNTKMMQINIRTRIQEVVYQALEKK